MIDTMLPHVLGLGPSVDKSLLAEVAQGGFVIVVSGGGRYAEAQAAPQELLR